MTNLKADGAAVVLVKRVKHVMRIGAGIYKKNAHKYQGVKELHMLARRAREGRWLIWMTGDVDLTLFQKHIALSNR